MCTEAMKLRKIETWWEIIHIELSSQISGGSENNLICIIKFIRCPDGMQLWWLHSAYQYVFPIIRNQLLHPQLHLWWIFSSSFWLKIQDILSVKKLRRLLVSPAFLNQLFVLCFAISSFSFQLTTQEGNKSANLWRY